MRCEGLQLPDGVVAIVCGGGRPKKCSAATCTKASVVLCDWKLHSRDASGKRRFTGKRCSDPLCDEHRHRVGPGKDLCPCHYERAVREGLLAGDVAEKAST